MVKRKQRTISRGKQIRHRLELVAVRCLSAAVQLLSRRHVRALGRFVGQGVFLFASSARKIALANLDLAYGDSISQARKKEIARGSFQNAVATMLGLLWMPRFRSEPVEKYVEVTEESWAMLRRLKSRGKGIMFITLHHGDWEMMGAAGGKLFAPVVVVMEEMQNKRLGDYFALLRSTMGTEVVFQVTAATKLMRALRRNESVGLLIDLNAVWRLGGIWVDFFGKPVFTHSAVAGLALHTGAAVVGAHARPLPGGRVRIELREVPVPAASGDKDIDTLRTSQVFLSYCEDVIRQEPDDWLWSYKRWKITPTNDTAGYPFYAQPIQDRRSGAGSAVRARRMKRNLRSNAN